ncbi:50S ribosomal protein L4 [bacterium Unc6]|nr:50S ribosomal protein L4 [bacterium Unc6]
MFEIAVKNIKGENVGQVSLDEAIFNGKINKDVLHEIQVMAEANLRKGTASTKTRGEVSGGGKKPWRQKGTGRARAGSIRSPLWRHGGIVFGPHPRNFHYSVNKKIRKIALVSALNSTLKENALFVIDAFNLDSSKTKNAASAISSIGVRKPVLFVFDKITTEVNRVTRNIEGVRIIISSNLDAYSVLRSRSVVFTKDALNSIIERLKK